MFFSSETKWNVVRSKIKLRKSSTNKACQAGKDTKPQLFGQPLCKICPEGDSLPKPITVSMNYTFNINTPQLKDAEINSS